MRLCALTAVTGLMLIGTALADESLKLEQEADRLSYSLGHQIGEDFKRQSISLDSDAVVRGINDGFASIPPLLDRQDMDKRLGRLKGQITDDMRSDQARRVKERKATAERKRHEGQVFLEANANKPGVKTHSSGLQYRIIREGEGDKPTSQDVVTIHYKGRLLDGREFDNSYTKGKPATVRVTDMILGLREAILLMQPGAKWELFIPPDLAYGRGQPLAHQTVIAEIELLSVGGEDSAATDNGSETTQLEGRP